MSVSGDELSYPGEVARHPHHDSRLVPGPTPDTPGHHPRHNPPEVLRLDGERPSGVSVAGVLASVPVAGTEEDERNVLRLAGESVQSHALRVTQDGNLELRTDSVTLI